MRTVLLALLLVGCASTPPSIKPQAPRVDCRQAEPRATPAAPREDEWLEEAQGAARLSQAAVLWVREVLGLREADRRLWAAQEACLDDYGKAGHIRR